MKNEEVKKVEGKEVGTLKELMVKAKKNEWIHGGAVRGEEKMC